MVLFRIPGFLALLLLVNFCTAQNRSYNTIFDSLVVHDTSAPVIEYTGAWPGAQKQDGDIIKQLLNDKGHTEEQLFWYMHHASSDTTLPKSLSDTLKIWKHSLAKKIIEKYFLRYWESDNEAWREIVKADPVNSELLEDFANKYIGSPVPKRKEESVFYWLLQKGKEDSVLNMLKWMVASDVSVIRIYKLLKELGFSKNNAIRAEALKILFACLEKEDGLLLLDLALCLDEATGIKYLQKWFWYYASQKLAPVPPPGSRPLWKGTYSDTPPALWELMRLFDRYSPWLSKALGKQLWVEFASRMPYWDVYAGEPVYFQLSVLESIFTDSSLTKKEKQQMLLALTYHNYPNDKSRNRYLQLVKQAWPDGNIPEYDFIKLNLCEMLTWQKPVMYPAALRVFNVKEVVADIKKAGISDLQLNTDYWQFKFSQYDSDEYRDDPFGHHFYFVINETGLLREIRVPISAGPASLLQVFTARFEALLVKIGVRDIQVREEITNYNTGYLHKLFVRSNEGAYKMEFEEKEYGHFYPQRLVKMLNLLLMKKGRKERLIELEYPYSGHEFGLFEPDKIKPFLDKYHVRCFAVGNGRESSTKGKVELK